MLLGIDALNNSNSYVLSPLHSIFWCAGHWARTLCVAQPMS